MAYLYLDTSFGQLVGLLDDSFEPIEWQRRPESKSSQFLHRQLYELLEQHSLKALQIKGLIYCSGPGSYTGMRQTLGFAQVMNQEAIKCYSFYHFEVPRMLGIEQGLFCSNAFKGETFLYEWNGDQIQKSLIKSDQKKQILENISVKKYSIDGEFNSTHTLIEKYSKTFFPIVLEQNLQKDLYYYRDLEVEFKVSVGES